MKSISLFILSLFLACSNNNTPSSEDFLGYEGPPADISLKEENHMMTEEQISADLIQEKKIKKNAYLSFETQDINTTHSKILQLTSQYKGYLQNEKSGKSYNRISQTLTLRIPSDKFDNFLDELSKEVAYFDQRNITQEDVTEEFIDLEARLKTKRELEARYKELLTKANSVKDMLEIERELSNIREEIESKQGRLQYLHNQVSMSTIAIEFYKVTTDTGITKSYGQKILNAIKGGWNGISVVFLGLIYLWPLFFVAIILVIIIRVLVRLRKKRSR